MQLSRIIAVVGVLATIPTIGHAQQAPAEVNHANAGLDDIKRTIAMQSQAILKLREQVKALEARVAELEKAKPNKPADHP